MKQIRARPGNLASIILLTALYYAMTWINVWLAFAVFRVDAPFFGIITALPAAMLLAMTPVSLGSLGLAEGVYVCYASLMGVLPAEAALMGLFLRMKIIVMGGIGWLLHLTWNESTHAEVMDMEGSETYDHTNGQ